MAKSNFWSENKMNIIGWLVVLIVGAGLGLAAYLFSQQQLAVRKDVLQLGVGEHVKGAADAKVTIIEYGDFQCPACASYFPTINEVAKRTDVRVVFRHLPLTSIHRNAVSAAVAAEAAAVQGKFWEMHDLLYGTQETWSTLEDPKSHYLKLANDLKLDIAKFASDLGNQTLLDKVLAGIDEADRLGINSTPTFYINNEPVTVIPSLEAFNREIDKRK